MPLIRIEFDNRVVSRPDAEALSVSAQQIVAEVSKIEDVFVYANSSEIKIKTAPIEIFVEISASKLPDAEQFRSAIREKLKSWKNDRAFKHKINLTVIPMNWSFETDI